MLYINKKENEVQNNENINPIGKQGHELINQKARFFINENKKVSQYIKNKPKNNQLNNDSKHVKNAFEELIDYIPEYQYDIKPNRNKIAKMKKSKDAFKPVPLNQLETNSNRFYNFCEAFLYICKHCKKYHGKYTREYCKHYLKECYIIDFVHDNFVPITSNLSKKQFNKYFFYAQRELKYL